MAAAPAEFRRATATRGGYIFLSVVNPGASSLRGAHTIQSNRVHVQNLDSAVNDRRTVHAFAKSQDSGPSQLSSIEKK